jgi:hypothetical protein
MHPLIQLKRATPVFLIALACIIGFLPKAQAVTPAPDGGYPGGNTAEGQAALLHLTTGGFNTAVGFLSLRSDTMGSFNTAVGAGALLSNVGLGNGTGNENTATGTGALLSNTTGSDNTANGAFALVSNVDGIYNTAVGDGALKSNTGGTANTAVGFNALPFIANGFENIAIGNGAGGSVTTAGNVICVGSSGADVSNTTWIGNVYGVMTQSGTTAPVIVSDGGQLGTVASSERFKKDITTMEKASEAILSMRPVTFHYKTDAKGTPQFGLIAEEVAKLNPALVLPDKEGKPYTVRYDAVNAMLLNEFLKEHKRVQQQEVTIAQLKKDFQVTVAQLTQRLDEQASQIQKVSAQLELSKAAPQTVLNNQ